MVFTQRAFLIYGCAIHNELQYDLQPLLLHICKDQTVASSSKNGVKKDNFY